MGPRVDLEPVVGVSQEQHLRTVWAALCIIGCAGFVAGCEATVTGTETIALSVIPEMAQCDAREHGETVGMYDRAQHTLTVPKSMGSLDVYCTALGYKDKRVSLVPDNSAAGRIGGALIDYGPFTSRYGYPATLLITMETSERQGAPL
jgi:hypothetical protein